MQAYHIIMDENKALRSFTEAEVSEDPVVVLGCGHVLPMTSLDGHVELRKAYSMDSHGRWAQPLPLKASQLFCMTPKHHHTHKVIQPRSLRQLLNVCTKSSCCFQAELLHVTGTATPRKP